MGSFTHLGSARIGTVKEGPTANLGSVIVSQTAPIVFAADGTVTAICNVPAGSHILNIHIDTTTVFNAATTNTLKLGTTSGGAELVAATAIGPLGRAVTATTALYAAFVVGTADVTVYATYNQTGTVATTGAGRVTVMYAVRNSDGTVGNAP